MSALHAQTRLPPVTKWLLAFQVCNSFNFTVAIGPPLVLLARYLGGDEAWIGLLTSVPAFLIALQILSPPMVERYGGRTIMLRGWTARSFMLLAIVPLPLLVGRLPDAALLAILFGAVCGFSAIRGFASGAWLPWVNQILRREQQGYFFGLEQRVINASVFVGLLLIGAFLGADAQGWQYAVTYFSAFAAGMLSVVFLSKVPPSPPPIPEGAVGTRWRDIRRKCTRLMRYRPFRRAAWFIGFYSFAVASFPIFLVLYLREDLGWADGGVLQLHAATTFGVLMTSVLWGRMSDRVGSKPLLQLADAGQIFTILYWFFCAVGWMPTSAIFLVTVHLAWGVFFSMHFVAQTRLVLGCLPRRDVSMGAALMAVFGALAAGASPLVWGWILGVLRTPHEIAVAAPTSLGFAVFFAATVILLALSQLLLRRIPEPRALSAGTVFVQLVYAWPARVLSALPVRPGRGG